MESSDINWIVEFVSKYFNKLSKKRLLLVLSGGAGRRSVLARFHELGIEITCFHDRQPEWAIPYVKDWIIIDSKQQQFTSLLVKDHLEALGVTCSPSSYYDGVMSYDEFGVEIAAKLGDELQIPSLSRRIVQQFRNKGLFRRLCLQQGVASPLFIGCNHHSLLSFQHLQELLDGEGVHYPVVFKPAEGAGSKFVKLCNDSNELKEAFESFKFRDYDQLRKDAHFTIDDTTNNNNNNNNSNEGNARFECTFVVEEYIPGAEVDVDCIVQKGQLLFHSISDNKPCRSIHSDLFHSNIHNSDIHCSAHSANNSNNDSYDDLLSANNNLLNSNCSSSSSSCNISSSVRMDFRERGGVCPSQLPLTHQRNIITAVKNLLAAFQEELLTGVFHFECIVAAQGIVYPIDFNLRLGGAETCTMVRTVWGIDLAQYAAALALNIDLSKDSYPSSPRCVCSSTNYVPDGHSHLIQLTSITGRDKLIQHPFYVAQELFFGPGDILRCPPLNTDYIGWCVARGSTKEEADSNLMEMEELMTFQFQQYS